MKALTSLEALRAQHDYATAKKKEGFDYALVVGSAFIRGIRDLGYKSNGNAIDELVDNAIEAGASTIKALFGFGKSEAKPASIAIMDDGHGMEPEMLRLAVVWGGTHRENSRFGWGRYGYGLPSAAVSIARRYTVYSKTDSSRWYSVTIDLDEIAAGHYNKGGQVVVPHPKQAVLPKTLKAEFDKTFRNAKHGTIILLEQLDRLEYKIGSRLQSHLLQNLGTTYRNRLRNVQLYVNDTKVESVDPLFLMPEGRFYNVDDDRAEPLPATVINIKATETSPGGQIRIRYSYLPPTFNRVDKASNSGANSNMNERHPVMKDTNGFIVLRNGRQIDVVTKNPWTTFVIYDRFLKVELDFDATLDEDFGVTTSKQQITLSERMWNILKEHRIDKALDEMRARNRHDRRAYEVQEPKEATKKRPSEAAMEAAQTAIKRSASVESLEQEIAKQRALDREIRRRAEEAQLEPSVVEAAVKEEIARRPFRLLREASLEGPFYRVEQIGGQTAVHLNTCHRFFVDLYAGPKSNSAVRAALEVLLFAIGSTEVDASREYAAFYRRERGEWSRRLELSLEKLDEMAEVHAVEEEQEPLVS